MGLVQKQIEEDGRLKYTVYMSFIQIYNEKVYDCLQDSEHNLPLKVRESKYIGRVYEIIGLGIYVEGLTEYAVTSLQA
jgi:hypothetical protein